MGIHILVTGGTFDKEYNERTGALYFKDSHVSELLRLGRAKIAVSVQTLMLIDSLEMSDTDRQLILESCLSSPEEQIIITHGTDTMAATAAVLGPKVKNKTVVLTGAMIPFTFGSSDGLFNLGSAIAFVQSLPQGVYIAMNGRYFRWDNVRKNQALGEFEELSPQLVNQS